MTKLEQAIKDLKAHFESADECEDIEIVLNADDWDASMLSIEDYVGGLIQQEVDFLKEDVEEKDEIEEEEDE